MWSETRVPSDSSCSSPYEAAVFGWLMGEIVLPSDGCAGEIVEVSTVIAGGGASGEPKTGMNSLFGPVIVSIRSAKHKRQDLTHKTIIIENANVSFGSQGSSVLDTVNSALGSAPLLT